MLAHNIFDCPLPHRLTSTARMLGHSCPERLNACFLCGAPLPPPPAPPTLPSVPATPSASPHTPSDPTSLLLPHALGAAAVLMLLVLLICCRFLPASAIRGLERKIRRGCSFSHSASLAALAAQSPRLHSSIRFPPDARACSMAPRTDRPSSRPTRLHRWCHPRPPEACARSMAAACARSMAARTGRPRSGDTHWHRAARGREPPGRPRRARRTSRLARCTWSRVWWAVP
jgi:hypothetical protein